MLRKEKSRTESISTSEMKYICISNFARKWLMESYFWNKYRWDKSLSCEVICSTTCLTIAQIQPKAHCKSNLFSSAGKVFCYRKICLYKGMTLESSCIALTCTYVYWARFKFDLESSILHATPLVFHLCFFCTGTIIVLYVYNLRQSSSIQKHTVSRKYDKIQQSRNGDNKDLTLQRRIVLLHSTVFVFFALSVELFVMSIISKQYLYKAAHSWNSYLLWIFTRQ